MLSHDPHSYIDFKQPKIDHIDFDLQLDFERRTIKGTATYKMDVPIQGSLFLDTREISIEEISSQGVPLDWEIDQEHPIFGSRLHLRQMSGQQQFRIKYETSPSASALQWLPPEQTLGQEQPFLFSQCQSIHARSVFPCQDSPSIRFTYSASVTVPRPLLAAMSAGPEGVEPANGNRIFHFRMPQRIPAYLFAIVAGNLAFEDISARCRIYAEPETLAAAVWEFAKTEETIILAEKLLGPYEWDRYDLVIMPPSFPYGGMENPRLNFITPTLLVGDRSMTDVITHELAHAWTGNLVTNATWKDFWLNEGWTVYGERRITEASEGKDLVQLKAAIEREDMFEVMTRLGEDSPTTQLQFDQEGRNPGDVLTVIQYTKGCEFLIQLENAVGRARWDDFIQKYIRRFRFGSITTPDFLALLQAEVPEALEKVDVDEWLYQPGFPASAGPIHSSLLTEVEEGLAAFARGALPQKSRIENWNPDQVYLFFRRLPKNISKDQCLELETLFDLGTSRNAYFLATYFEIAICSGYEEIFPRVEKFIAEIGRILFIARVFRAMVKTDWTQEKARPLLEKYRQQHHPITVAYLEKVLTEAGL